MLQSMGSQRVRHDRATELNISFTQTQKFRVEANVTAESKEDRNILEWYLLLFLIM